MTIGAGFVCHDGLVLCADTQETAGYLKTRTDKLLTFEQDNCVVGAVGSGKAILVDMAVEKIFDALLTYHGETQFGVQDIIERSIVKLYKNQFAAFPTDDREGMIVELLLAVKTKVSPPVLLHAVGPAVRIVHKYSVIG